MNEEMNQDGKQMEAYKALRTAQMEFQPIHLDKTAEVRGRSKGGNAYTYSYDYASLEAIYAATKPALHKHGFLIMQPCVVRYEPVMRYNEVADREYQALQAHVLARFELWHESGGLIAAPEMEMLAASTDPQAVGSAMTYAQRYQYSKFLGLTTESDDDGNRAEGNEAETGDRRPKSSGQAAGRKPGGAQGRGQEKGSQGGSQASSRKVKQVKDAKGKVRWIDGKCADHKYQADNGLINEGQFNDLVTALKQKNIPLQKWTEWLNRVYGVKFYDIRQEMLAGIEDVVYNRPGEIMEVS